MSSRGPPSHACHPPDWFELLICPSLSLFEHIASPQSCQWVVFFFWGGDLCSCYILLIQAMSTSSARSIHRPPCARFLHFLISIRLLLTPLYHRRIFPVFSPLSLLLSSFLSVSLFRHCSGWSPCGTPCRVPNLFIISALCKDARGMLKYTPPLSGYKWAAVSHASFQMTWTQGWTERPNTNAVLKFRAKALARPPACSSATNGPSLGTDPAKNTRAQKLSALAGCLERTQPRQKLSSETSLRPD